MIEEVDADASPDDDIETVEVEAEAEEIEEQESEDGSSPSEETEDKPDPFQQRIDKLTKRFRETERDLDAVARERDQLQKKLAELERTATREPERSLADFEYDEKKYQSYVFEQAEKRAEAAAERIALKYTSESETSRQEVEFTKREREFAAEVEDYKEVGYDPDLKISAPMADEIRASDIGPEMLYYLGKNPDEASRISRLSERAAIRELVKLEGRLLDEKSRAGKKPVSKAPPPPSKRVKGASDSLRVAPTDPRSDKMSDEEWFRAEALRVAKLKAG
jgi:hypothetical protein